MAFISNGGELDLQWPDGQGLIASWEARRLCWKARRRWSDNGLLRLKCTPHH